jgi:hypothetical protein
VPVSVCLGLEMGRAGSGFMLYITQPRGSGLARRYSPAQPVNPRGRARACIQCSLCNEVDHVRSRRPSPGSGASSGGVSGGSSGDSSRSSRGSSSGSRGIKVGKGCSELRSLTEKLVYLRLTTIVLIYYRTQSYLLSTSCCPVLPGPSVS